MLLQLVSLIGALMVLGAYAALQKRWLRAEDPWYNVLNFAGAALLTWVALEDRRWGFVMLEGAWALLSLVPLVIRGKRDSGFGIRDS